VPLVEWQASLDRIGSQPVAALRAMQQLAHVDSEQVKQHGSTVLRDAVWLLRHGCDLRRMRKATFVDTFAKAVAAHAALLNGAHSLHKLRQVIGDMLELVAQDPQTYTNGLCTAQMATAQTTLHCITFARASGVR
jgi:hypothetical protein